jgi:hypothetical protein
MRIKKVGAQQQHNDVCLIQLCRNFRFPFLSCDNGSVVPVFNQRLFSQVGKVLAESFEAFSIGVRIGQEHTQSSNDI